MPHIIIEHSVDIESQIDMADLLRAAHNALADKGIDRARIKTRAVPISHCFVGNHDCNEGSMIHTTLLLLEGRDIALKQEYATAINDAVKGIVSAKITECSYTLEVRDMVKDTYIL